MKQEKTQAQKSLDAAGDSGYHGAMEKHYATMEDGDLCALTGTDPEAFAELSRRYVGLVRGAAARFPARPGLERDDLLQEGLLGLYAAALGFSPETGEDFRAYAGACVRNRMADAARRQQSRRNRPLNESLSLESEAAAGLSVRGPEDLMELREQLRGLFQRLGRALTPLEREALSLYLSGVDRTEIEASGMNLKAFDNALYRVRRKLKQSE